MAHGVDVAGVLVQSHDRGLGGHDALTADVDQRVGGPEVDRDVAPAYGALEEGGHGENPGR
jgi:hypothetical protein